MPELAAALRQLVEGRYQLIAQSIPNEGDPTGGSRNQCAAGSDATKESDAV